MNINFSKTEEKFLERSGNKEISTKIPYIVTESVPQLGLLMSLRFIEWVSENPEGVISLPTGKTPQYFIEYTHKILDNWDSEEIQKVLSDNVDARFLNVPIDLNASRVDAFARRLR